MGKRTGLAAIRLAVAMSEDERIALTPAEAVALVDGLIRVDHQRCLEYGTACREACLQACFMIHVIQPFQEHPLLRSPDGITAQEALAL